MVKGMLNYILMKRQYNSVKEILGEVAIPVVAIDMNAMIIMVNDKFHQEYGWTRQELIGQPVTSIMPPYLRDAHQVGFSRFVATENPRILGKPVRVSVCHKNQDIIDAELFILSDKSDNQWQFAATITPL